MAKFQIQRKHSNGGLFTIFALAYLGLLVLFAWQTWGLVNFLFPDDQILMKLLTLFSFDIMAFLWGCGHLFYRFAHPTSKTAVKWGWGVTNALSLMATVLYMVIQYMFRFHVVIDNNLVSLGDGISIAALVFNIGILTVFLYYEISTRFPNEDEFEFVEQQKNTVSPLKLYSPGKDKDEQHAVPTEELHPTVENTGNGHQPQSEEVFRDGQNH